MNPGVKTLWVEALRSGEYKQGRMELHSANNEFCCLGVLCSIAVKQGVISKPESYGGAYRYGKTETNAGSSAYLPRAVQTWAGLDNSDPKIAGAFLSQLNDGIENALDGVVEAQKTFAEIADLIEEHL